MGTNCSHKNKDYFVYFAGVLRAKEQKIQKQDYKLAWKLRRHFIN